jgi:hypothetical protein
VAKPCGGCGQSRRARQALLRGKFVDINSDGASRVTLYGDDPSCELYHGLFQAAYLYVVGARTDKERLFLRQNLVDAVAYSNANGKLPISQLVKPTSLCHDRVVALLGA